MRLNLTPSQIALMYDIGEFDIAQAGPRERRALEDLVDARYVEAAPDPYAARFQLTELGLAFLRGQWPQAAE